jgi:GTP-binding protein HflX
MHRRIIIDNNKKPRVLIVGIQLFNKSDIDFEVLELASLCKTEDDEVVDSYIVKADNIISSTFITRDKLESIKEIAIQNNIDKIIFNVDLLARQRKNISQIMNLKIVDRNEVILNIFHQHARTKVSKIEIQLARLKYAYSRLVGIYDNLSRTGGGIGTKGPGEQEIEYRRREIRVEIKKLRNKLDKIKERKTVQSNKRQDEFKCAIVGYTNSGKSTIMKSLTGYKSYIKDELFATLDPITKILHFNSYDTAVITDTIGFIQNAPPELINSFYETLSEIEDADLNLHIVDISSPYYQEQLETVDNVMNKLKFCQESIIVFNKIDLIYDEILLKNIKEKFPDAIFISALFNENITNLTDRIYSIYNRTYNTLELPIEKCGIFYSSVKNKIPIKIVYNKDKCIVKFRKIYNNLIDRELK